jgi:LacI family transcriptional regulator
VFASSDVQAIGAWQALRHRGLSVPEDVAIVGYDDVKVSRFIGLSTVSQKMHVIGEATADLLLRRLQGTETSDPVSRLVSPELQIRASSALEEAEYA